MTLERWQRIEELFHAALQCERDGYARFLDETCGGDDELRRQVEGLLVSHNEAGDFIEEAPLAGAISSAAGESSAESPATNASLMGRRISHYEIHALLGAGGMGEVYLSLDLKLGRPVALKVLPAHFIDSDAQVQRFEREAYAASALNHPNILTIHEIGRDGDTYFIAAEFVTGQTLREKMAAGELSLREALSVAIQIANALAAAHAAGIMHRDIKPENVMVRPDGLVKVLDFGLAKPEAAEPVALGAALAPTLSMQTDAESAMGTIAYLSPEQVRRDRIDHRTDLFGLGVALYEMVAGKRPFTGGSAQDICEKIVGSDPVPITRARPDLPASLEPIINRALAKNPDARYQTAVEFRDDLKGLEGEIESESIGPRGLGVSAPASIPGTRRLALFVLIAVVLIGLTVSLFSSWFGKGREAEKPTALRSIAVLPFKQLTDGRDEQMELGMADALITTLSNVREITVRPTSAIRKYWSSAQDPVAAGRELRVDAVLDGSIVRVGDHTRVTVQLVRVRDGRPVWAETLDETSNDIFAVQDAISEKTAEALELTLTGEQRQRLRKHFTQNKEAYQLYLKGRYLWARRTAEDLQKAIGYFQQAIARDPQYALAYAGLADSNALLNLYSGTQFTNAFPRARDAAAKALAIDDSLAEAHATLAYVKYNYEWDWSGARKEFQRAIELNPNYATAHQWYAEYLFYMERFDEALVEINRAFELDPSSVIINLELGTPYLYRRQYDKAMEKYLKALDLDPNSPLSLCSLAICYEQTGMYDQAAATYQKIRRYKMGLTGLGYVLAISGRRAEARAVLEELMSPSGKQQPSPYNIARVYAGLGDKEKALSWLEKAFNVRDERIVMLKVDPKLDLLRSDPRFDALLRDVGLAG